MQVTHPAAAECMYLGMNEWMDGRIHACTYASTYVCSYVCI